MIWYFKFSLADLDRMSLEFFLKMLDQIVVIQRMIKGTSKSKASTLHGETPPEDDADQKAWLKQMAEKTAEQWQRGENA